MEIALSKANLEEIYSLSNDDKLNLVNLIIKSMQTAVGKIKEKRAVSEAHHIDDMLCGSLHLPEGFDYDQALKESMSEKYQIR